MTPMGGYRTIQSSDWDDGRVTVIRRNTFIILRMAPLIVRKGTIILDTAVEISLSLLFDKYC